VAGEAADAAEKEKAIIFTRIRDSAKRRDQQEFNGVGDTRSKEASMVVGGASNNGDVVVYKTVYIKDSKKYTVSQLPVKAALHRNNRRKRRLQHLLGFQQSTNQMAEVGTATEKALKNLIACFQTKVRLEQERANYWQQEYLKLKTAASFGNNNNSIIKITTSNDSANQKAQMSSSPSLSSSTRHQQKQQQNMVMEFQGTSETESLSKRGGGGGVAGGGGLELSSAAAAATALGGSSCSPHHQWGGVMKEAAASPNNTAGDQDSVLPRGAKLLENTITAGERGPSSSSSLPPQREQEREHPKATALIIEVSAEAAAAAELRTQTSHTICNVGDHDNGLHQVNTSASRPKEHQEEDDDEAAQQKKGKDKAAGDVKGGGDGREMAKVSREGINGGDGREMAQVSTEGISNKTSVDSVSEKRKKMMITKKHQQTDSTTTDATSFSPPPTSSTVVKLPLEIKKHLRNSVHYKLLNYHYGNYSDNNIRRATSSLSSSSKKFAVLSFQLDKITSSKTFRGSSKRSSSSRIKYGYLVNQFIIACIIIIIL